MAGRTTIKTIKTIKKSEVRILNSLKNDFPNRWNSRTSNHWKNNFQTVKITFLKQLEEQLQNCWNNNFLTLRRTMNKQSKELLWKSNKNFFPTVRWETSNRKNKLDLVKDIIPCGWKLKGIPDLLLLRQKHINKWKMNKHSSLEHINEQKYLVPAAVHDGVEWLRGVVRSVQPDSSGDVINHVQVGEVLKRSPTLRVDLPHHHTWKLKSSTDQIQTSASPAAIITGTSISTN